MHRVSERNQPGGYIVYDSHNMSFWERQDYGDIEKISGFQGPGGEKIKMGGAPRTLGQ